ncbi:hypothetical protein FHR75_003416 [Kineococcus radiotolerans]|uniref:Integral membrane protein n=2 Tax=Kineococcus radiotolerans TaxID=131568 RepID=A6WFW2_KINRD|nr:DUF4235 domain-containing protein [Kineococcus radiotolerans]ABS05701.1 conserved hypothetical protein [Kineococcus radiotolerans SRS30216 = ATCC BAA-149]MBB2902585.1 hypothetical protein [Kineococcus radiotolerans]
MSSIVWKLVGPGAGILATAVASRVTKKAWVAVTKSPPPDNPEDPDVAWKEALVWALASGAIIGVTRLIVERQAAVWYRKSFGELPPGLGPGDDGGAAQNA